MAPIDATEWDEPKEVKFSTTAGGKVLVQMEDEVVLQTRDVGVKSVAINPDGSRLATGCGDRTVRLWDARTGQLLLTLRGHGAAIEAVVFSPDGHRLASSDTDGQIRIWNAVPLE